MPVNLRLVAAAFVLTAGTSAGICSAQSQDGATVAQTIQTPNLIDLDFRGGTAVDFIQAIRKATGDRANIVVTPYVEDVRIPPMSLRRVDVFAAVGLLEGERAESPERSVMLKVRQLGAVSGGIAPLMKVIAEARFVQSPGRPEQSSIWSVADLIASGTSAEHITTAVSAALELLGPDSHKAQVRFHKETSLLLARANAEQIQIIESVIDQLRRSSVHRREQTLKPLHEEIAALRERAEAAQNDRRVIEKEAVERLRMAETANVRAEAMERRTAELEAAVARLRDELMQRESIIRALEEEAARLREQVKSRPDRE